MKDKPQAIIVNGEPSVWKGGSLQDLLAFQGVDLSAKGYAIAHNSEVVLKRDWSKRLVSPGDRVEIVSIYKGG